jgi:hypothetical protein
VTIPIAANLRTKGRQAMANLTKKERSEIQLSGWLGEVLADSSNTLYFRQIWNRNHPDDRPLDLLPFYNRRIECLSLLMKLGGNELRAGDVERIQALIQTVREENSGPGDDAAE